MIEEQAKMCDVTSLELRLEVAGMSYVAQNSEEGSRAGIRSSSAFRQSGFKSAGVHIAFLLSDDLLASNAVVGLQFAVVTVE